MRKTSLLFVLALVLVAGCSSSDRTYRRYPYPDRTESGSYDPVVGRTTDGRRIYEDRSGRLYTLDRSGRRVYRGDSDRRGTYDGTYRRPSGARGRTSNAPPAHAKAKGRYKEKENKQYKEKDNKQKGGSRGKGNKKN